MSYPRRSYFPNPRLQFQMIAAANVLALASTVLMALLLLLTEMHLEGCAAFLPLAQGSLRSGVAAQEKNLLLIGAGIAACQFVLFNLAAVIFSHRIAGPLYRLQSHLKAVAAGGPPVDVKFRDGDLYQELAVACNELMARLRQAPKG